MPVLFFCRKKNQKRLSKTLLNLYKVFGVTFFIDVPENNQGTCAG
jgi:hypothetical protein